MATLNRFDQPRRFLEHLDKQSYRDFELIVVDQNPDDRLVDLICHYKTRFPISHIRSNTVGVSLARNLGLQHVNGDLVGFPDDDCWYGERLLEQVVAHFESHPEWDGLSGRTIDARGITSLGRYDREAGRLNRYNIWTRTNTNTIFLRLAMIASLAGFNTALGLNIDGIWGGAEDVEYVLQAVEKDYYIQYLPDLTIYHENPVPVYDAKALLRARSYGAGMGGVLRAYRYPLWFVANTWGRALAGCGFYLLSCNKPKALYHWQTLLGRITGWAQWPPG